MNTPAVACPWGRSSEYPWGDGLPKDGPDVVDVNTLPLLRKKKVI